MRYFLFVLSLLLLTGSTRSQDSLQVLQNSFSEVIGGVETQNGARIDVTCRFSLNVPAATRIDSIRIGRFVFGFPPDSLPVFQPQDTFRLTLRTSYQSRLKDRHYLTVSWIAGQQWQRYKQTDALKRYLRSHPKIAAIIYYEQQGDKKHIVLKKFDRAESHSAP